MLIIQCDAKIIKMHENIGFMNRLMLSQDKKAVAHSSCLFGKERLYLAFPS